MVNRIISSPIIPPLRFCLLFASQLTWTGTHASAALLNEVSIEAGAYVYEEPAYARLHGHMLGLRGRLSNHPSEGLGWAAEALLAKGSADYSSPQSGNGTNEPVVLAEVRLLADFSFKLLGTQISPYLGVGNRILINDSTGYMTDRGYAGYFRKSRYLYLPLGIALRSEISPSREITSRVEYDKLNHGEQTSALDAGTIVHPQRHGRGWRASVGFGSAAWQLEGFVRSWKIRNSEVRAFYTEPANRTLESGIAITTRW